MTDADLLIAVDEIIKAMEGGFADSIMFDSLIFILDGNPLNTDDMSAMDRMAYITLLLVRHMLTKQTS